ncbi:MAG: hypothetical protein BAJALOKI3v1_50019 [Promethearchaeota archaeon]|nr:MAG: hypothetical protein BAJALOKI3v1_50019 [Candidatus Lokiarchaeota archaeon]
MEQEESSIFVKFYLRDKRSILDNDGVKYYEIEPSIIWVSQNYVGCLSADIQRAYIDCVPKNGLKVYIICLMVKRKSESLYNYPIVTDVVTDQLVVDKIVKELEKPSIQRTYMSHKKRDKFLAIKVFEGFIDDRKL